MVSKKNTAEISAKDIWENIWSGVSSLLDFFAVLENLGVVNDKLYVSGLLRKVWLCYSCISVIKCVWKRTYQTYYCCFTPRFELFNGFNLSRDEVI